MKVFTSVFNPNAKCHKCQSKFQLKRRRQCIICSTIYTEFLFCKKCSIKENSPTLGFLAPKRYCLDCYHNSLSDQKHKSNNEESKHHESPPKPASVSENKSIHSSSSTVSNSASIIKKPSTVIPSEIKEPKPSPQPDNSLIKNSANSLDDTEVSTINEDLKELTFKETKSEDLHILPTRANVIKN